MVAFPHCKINLGLNVIRKRDDGYHDIVTGFYPIGLTDILEIVPASEFAFSVSGDPIAGDHGENLCVKAYRLVRRHHDVPDVKIHLHKKIPSGAGLGGGSSNAAFTLRILNEIFDLKLSGVTLANYAGQLGSDCAFFLKDVPQTGTGRGDMLTPLSLSLKGRHLVLIKPDIHVSTAQAYAGIAPKSPDAELSNIISNKPVEQWRHLVKNDFEATVFDAYPRIREIKEALYKNGALYASMSGSGSAVYAIFSNPMQLQHLFPGMFYWTGPLTM